MYVVQGQGLGVVHVAPQPPKGVPGIWQGFKTKGSRGPWQEERAMRSGGGSTRRTVTSEHDCFCSNITSVPYSLKDCGKATPPSAPRFLIPPTVGYPLLNQISEQV